MDAHCWMAVSFKKTEIFSTLNAFSFFISIYYDGTIQMHFTFIFFPSSLPFLFLLLIVLRVEVAVLWKHTKGINMKKKKSCQLPFLVQVFIPPLNNILFKT
jgi:hypothetical protein